MTFSEWIHSNSEYNAMFVTILQKFSLPILIKLDRNLSYGIIDILTGGNGQGSFLELDKEMTQIELILLKDINEIIINDLNFAWDPIHQIRAKYIRTEINSEFIKIVPLESKVISVNYEIHFNGVTGILKLVYPYSTLFPMRNELYTNE
jgi:flagellar motor switch protein FliM